MATNQNADMVELAAIRAYGYLRSTEKLRHDVTVTSVRDVTSADKPGMRDISGDAAMTQQPLGDDFHERDASAGCVSPSRTTTDSAPWPSDDADEEIFQI